MVRISLLMVVWLAASTVAARSPGEYCHAEVCLGDPVSRLAVPWQDRTLQKYRYLLIQSRRDPDFARKRLATVRRLFPGLDAGTRQQLLIHHPLVRGTWTVDSFSQPLYAKIRSICGYVRLRGFLRSEEGWKTSVDLLPVTDERGRQTFMVAEVRWQIPDVAPDSQRESELVASMRERYGEMSSRRSEKPGVVYYFYTYGVLPTLNFRLRHPLLDAGWLEAISPCQRAALHPGDTTG